MVAVVPDEKIELTAQVYPTGINRIGDRLSPAAKIDGIDERVDADVAVVDTGIAPLADLNVVGGYNCSSSDPTAWRDGNGHGTHVAGTIGAIDNATGVVGVAPGVRLWAVKILNDSGVGLLSSYVCGLDRWIAPLTAKIPTSALASRGRGMRSTLRVVVGRGGCAGNRLETRVREHRKRQRERDLVPGR